MSERKIGMIGLDTSHCPSFASILNKKKSKNQIKYAFPGGSNLFSKSTERVGKFTKELTKKYSVKMMDNIESIAENSDAIFLTSVDGRQHLEQFKILSKFSKPVFIDKPLACSYSDAKEIIAISEKTNTPVFSASSLRYSNGIYKESQTNDVESVEVYGKVPILEDYPGYFWYGIHSVEILYGILGTGCEELVINPGKNHDIIIGTWKDGRIGILHGIRYKKDYPWGFRIYAGNEIIKSENISKPSAYSLMLPHIIEFFKTKKSPISNSEMLEVIKVLEEINKARKIEGKSTIKL